MRYDFDRPILMHDKLDHMWTEKKVAFDELKIKDKLLDKKKLRKHINQHQINVYNKLLKDVVAVRKITYANDKVRVQKALECEREFMDAFKLILHSGYHLNEQEFLELIETLQIPQRMESV